MTEGKVLITGASSGIGLSISHKLLDVGYEVIGIARYSKKCPIENSSFHAEKIDLSDTVNLPDQFKKLLLKHENISAVICCAGRGQFGCLEEFSYTQIKSLIELNYISHAFLVRALVPLFKREGRGHIIFMGSESGLVGRKKGAIYCASKFAIRGMAQALREECATQGVRVCVINPGMVKTPFFDDLSFEPDNDDRHFVLADDIAKAVLMVLQARPGIVFDEINVSPLINSVQRKS